MMVAPFVSIGMQQWCSSDNINCTFMFATPQPLSAWLCLLYLTTENPLRFSWLPRVNRATALRNARVSMWKRDIPAYRSYQQCTEHHKPQPHQNMTQIRPLQPKLRRFTRGISHATHNNLVIKFVVARYFTSHILIWWCATDLWYMCNFVQELCKKVCAPL